jgi:CBS domain-containing protein
MNARAIMNTPVVAATKTASARDVAIQMLMGGYSGMPITDQDGSVVGIVSELDLIRALRADKPLDNTTVAEVMTPDAITVDVNASVEEVMEILDEKHVVRVPVLEDGKLVGLISRPDVLRAVIEPKYLRFG